MIRVIEGLEKWEVIKRASEGESWAYFDGLDWMKPSSQCESNLILLMNRLDAAIIDTSTPEIDWSKFDWDFFNQYGGLCIVTAENIAYKIDEPPLSPLYDLSESPFYYWPGGECPVPDNVEVEVLLRNGRSHKDTACGWGDSWEDGAVNLSDDYMLDIIAFRITGIISNG